MCVQIRQLFHNFFTHIAHWKYSRRIFKMAIAFLHFKTRLFCRCFPFVFVVYLWALQIEKKKKKTPKKSFIDTEVNQHRCCCWTKMRTETDRRKLFTHRKQKSTTSDSVRRSWTIAHDWICKLFLQSHKRIIWASRRQQLCEYIYIFCIARCTLQTNKEKKNKN